MPFLFGEGEANATELMPAPVYGIGAGPIWRGIFLPVRISASDES